MQYFIDNLDTFSIDEAAVVAPATIVYDGITASESMIYITFSALLLICQAKVQRMSEQV